MRSGSPRPSFGFWATILVVSIPLLYVLSFSPACYLVDYGSLPALEVARVYRPLVRGATGRFSFIAAPLQWYGDLFLPSPNLDISDESPVEVMRVALDIDEINEKLHLKERLGADE
jgi:hypothetical protein